MAKFKSGDRVKFANPMKAKFYGFKNGRAVVAGIDKVTGLVMCTDENAGNYTGVNPSDLVAANSATVCNDSLARALKTVNDITKKWGAKDGLNLLKELKASIVRERGDQFYREVEGYVKTGKEIPRNVVGKIGREIPESVLRRPTKLTGEIMDITGPKIKYRNSTSPVVANALAWKAQNAVACNVYSYAQLENRYGKYYLTMFAPGQRGSVVRDYKTKDEALRAFEIWKKGIITVDKVTPDFKDKTSNSAPVARNAGDWKAKMDKAKRLTEQAVANLNDATELCQDVEQRSDADGAGKSLCKRRMQAIDRALSALMVF